MDPGAPKYWAFISYSHRDAAAASRLQRALETYRLLRRLQGRETAVGPVPAFLKPVFRDREELQAGADLGATVREALAARASGSRSWSTSFTEHTRAAMARNRVWW